MVGAIADWFAVTALFKHPLGLPVPHTALIPRAQGRARPEPRGVRRRELPPGAGSSATGSPPRRSRGGSAAGSPSPRTYAASSTRSRRSRRSGSGKVRDDHIADLVTRRADPAVPRGADRAAGRSACWPRPSATASHHGLVDLALDELHGWLAGAPGHGRRGARAAGAVVGAAAAQRRGDPAGPQPSWSPGSPTSATDPDHRARPRSTRCSPSSPTTSSTTRTPRRGRSGSRTGCSTTRRWSSRASRCGTRCAARCRRRCVDPDGAVRERMATELAAFGARLREDDEPARPARRARRRRRGLRRRRATAPRSPR